jgi:hypothetical protein
MLLKLESKRCADLASSTYRYLFKFKLLFPVTRYLLLEPFPSTTRQRKWIKNLLITWYREMNESCRYIAIMIKITSGVYQSCPRMSQGVYVSSPWLVLALYRSWITSRIKWNLRTHITHTKHRVSKNSNVYKIVTLTWSCKEIVFPSWFLVSLTPIPSYSPCPWYGYRDCHDPDFSKIKISSCIHGILHFKIFFQSFEPYSLENIVKCPFFPSFRYKSFQKESVL